MYKYVRIGRRKVFPVWSPVRKKSRNTVIYTPLGVYMYYWTPDSTDYQRHTEFFLHLVRVNYKIVSRSKAVFIATGNNSGNSIITGVVSSEIRYIF